MALFGICRARSGRQRSEGGYPDALPPQETGPGQARFRRLAPFGCFGMVGSFTINLGPLIANQSCCFLIAGVGPGFHPHVEVEGARKPRLCGPEPTGAALFFLIVYLDGFLDDFTNTLPAYLYYKQGIRIISVRCIHYHSTALHKPPPPPSQRENSPQPLRHPMDLLHIIRLQPNASASLLDKREEKIKEYIPSLPRR